MTSARPDKLHTAAQRVADEVDNLRNVFGAPGDHGYSTREGQALYTLYMAWAKLRQALKPEAPDGSVIPIAIEMYRAQPGLSVGHFQDCFDEPCSIGQVEPLPQPRILLGMDVSTRMYLGREQVAGLLPLLQKFVAEGEI